jgi:hypothetical protein
MKLSKSDRLHTIVPMRLASSTTLCTDGSLAALAAAVVGEYGRGESTLQSCVQSDLMTPKEVAHMLRLSVGWVHDHSSGRCGPKIPHTAIGGQRRYSRAKIKAWLKTLEIE